VIYKGGPPNGNGRGPLPNVTPSSLTPQYYLTIFTG